VEISRVGIGNLEFGMLVVWIVKIRDVNKGRETDGRALNGPVVKFPSNLSV